MQAEVAQRRLSVSVGCMSDASQTSRQLLWPVARRRATAAFQHRSLSEPAPSWRLAGEPLICNLRRVGTSELTDARKGRRLSRNGGFQAAGSADAGEPRGRRFSWCVSSSSVCAFGSADSRDHSVFEPVASQVELGVRQALQRAAVGSPTYFTMSGYMSDHSSSGSDGDGERDHDGLWNRLAEAEAIIEGQRHQLESLHRLVDSLNSRRASAPAMGIVDCRNRLSSADAVLTQRGARRSLPTGLLEFRLDAQSTHSSGLLAPSESSMSRQFCALPVSVQFAALDAFRQDCTAATHSCSSSSARQGMQSSAGEAVESAKTSQEAVSTKSGDSSEDDDSSSCSTRAVAETLQNLGTDVDDETSAWWALSIASLWRTSDDLPLEPSLPISPRAINVQRHPHIAQATFQTDTPRARLGLLFL